MRISWWIGGYVIALGAALLAPLASSAPDGLERVAENEGFISAAREAPYAIIADYVAPGIANEALATIVAGFIGVSVVYVALAGGVYLAYRASANRRS